MTTYTFTKESVRKIADTVRRVQGTGNTIGSNGVKRRDYSEGSATVAYRIEIVSFIETTEFADYYLATYSSLLPEYDDMPSKQCIATTLVVINNFIPAGTKLIGFSTGYSKLTGEGESEENLPIYCVSIPLWETMEAEE